MNEPKREFAVIVGVTNPEASEEEYDVWGPYDEERAHEMVSEILEVWGREKHMPDMVFPYGEPYAEVRPMRRANHPFYSEGAQAAHNWFIEKSAWEESQR